jgi:hypothetical protein
MAAGAPSVSRAAAVTSPISLRGIRHMGAEGLPFSAIAAGTAPVKSKPFPPQPETRSLVV